MTRSEQDIIAEAMNVLVKESHDEYEQAKKIRDELEAEVAKHQKALKGYPKGEMGLTPDEIKNSPEYKAHKQNFNNAFEKLRTFNASFTKKFKKQIAADRDARFEMLKKQNDGK